MNVGATIRRKREEAGLSQADLSRKTGVTPAMINQVERGTRNPSLLLGAGIAKALGCSIDSLLSEDEE